MIVRNFEDVDIPDLLRIHQNFYESEFSISEFDVNNFIDKFVIADESNQIVSICGVRNIAEIIAVTDKNHSVRARREALMKMLEVSNFIARRSDFDSIHAFVQDKVWLNQLLRHGFKLTNGTTIIKSVA